MEVRVAFDGDDLALGSFTWVLAKAVAKLNAGDAVMLGGAKCVWSVWMIGGQGRVRGGDAAQRWERAAQSHGFTVTLRADETDVLMGNGNITEDVCVQHGVKCLELSQARVVVCVGGGSGAARQIALAPHPLESVFVIDAERSAGAVRSFPFHTVPDHIPVRRIPSQRR